MIAFAAVARGLEPLVAGVDFALRRGLVQAALAAQLPFEVLDGVGDVKVLPVYARRLEPAVEEPSRRADEGQPFLVLLVAGLLADQHHPGVGVASAEHRLRGVRPQRAVLAGTGFLAQLFQGL
jgi:hypothetical protein